MYVCICVCVYVFVRLIFLNNIIDKWRSIMRSSCIDLMLHSLHYCDDVTVDCKCMLVSHNCDTRFYKVISKSLGIDFINNTDFIFDDTHGRSCKEMYILYVVKFTKLLASERKHLWFHTVLQNDVLHIKMRKYHLSNGRLQQLLIQVCNKKQPYWLPVQKLLTSISSSSDDLCIKS